jgi:DNA invertase Pin-like site-specific DNA recombinase
MVCREWCKRQNEFEIEVVKVFREEGVSGKFMDRKSMNDAIRFLEKENNRYTKIHYFVVTDADRIARPDDIAEAFNLEQSIEALGVKIVTVNNKRDTDTDEGKFLHTIQYAVAGLERRKILRRIMNGKLSRMKNGGRPFPAPPLGYIREKSPDGKESADYIDAIK